MKVDTMTTETPSTSELEGLVRRLVDERLAVPSPFKHALVRNQTDEDFEGGAVRKIFERDLFRQGYLTLTD